MALLGSAEILAADDRPFELVECPEWGGQVRIATMSGAERDEFEAALYGRAESGETALDRHARVLIVAYCATDAEGSRLFRNPAEVEALGQKSFRPIRRLVESALRLNALTVEAGEDLEKNS
jgi:hypothetical protein